jgi:protein-S-isoprenylcysteine O-methyltransferase Ste14
MELFPALRLGWLNGWLFLAALSLMDAVCFRLFPKAVVERLFDRSGWSRQQVAFTVMGKLIALTSLVLIAFTPLKFGHSVLVIGACLSTFGLAGLVGALISFRDTPLDQPVAAGLYRISRHPQIISHLFTHLGILGEEDVCTRRHGDSYRAYLRRVPRYFVFF